MAARPLMLSPATPSPRLPLAPRLAPRRLAWVEEVDLATGATKAVVARPAPTAPTATDNFDMDGMAVRSENAFEPLGVLREDIDILIWLCPAL